MSIQTLRNDISACQTCKTFLPHAPRPVCAFSNKSKVQIIGQAPGQVVHDSGVPFADKSGDKLRGWLGVTKDQFYDPELFAIVPMGFCYPGKEGGGDAPPRPECAAQWHERIASEFESKPMTLLIGAYAQKHYLTTQRARNLTETVRSFREYMPEYFPLVHPSPLNFRWFAKNPWFEKEIVPQLQIEVKRVLGL